MEKLTSLADLSKKIDKQEDSYKMLIIIAFKKSGHWYAPWSSDHNKDSSPSFEESIDWINHWVKKQKLSVDSSCEPMIQYLNRVMDEHPIFSSKIISAHTINEFNSQSGI